MGTVDIRQSDEWSDYLKLYGWCSHQLPSGDIFRTMKLGPLCFGKLHRPTFFSTAELAQIEELANREKTTSVKISPATAESADALKQARFTRRGGIDLPSRTLYLDLTPNESELFKNFLPDCRVYINKANQQKDRVEVLQNPKRAQVENYYKIVSKRGIKKGFYVQSLDDQLRKIEVFKDKSFIVNAYSQKGEVLGTKMFLGFKNTVWYMHGGITDKGRERRAGYISMWEALRHFKSLGYKTVDFEGLADDRLKSFTKSWRGYTNFKLKFGGVVAEFPLPWSKYYRFLSPINIF